MSCYWYLHCKDCDIDHAANEDIAQGFNHGQDILRAIYHLRKAIISLTLADHMYLSFEIMAHPGCGSIIGRFLVTHKDHHLDMQNEYGQCEPIEEATT